MIKSLKPLALQAYFFAQRYDYNNNRLKIEFQTILSKYNKGKA